MTCCLSYLSIELCRPMRDLRSQRIQTPNPASKNLKENPKCEKLFMQLFCFTAPVAAIDLCYALSVCYGGRLPLAAQDDITTQNATSGYNGAFITGPASNPLSFLNGAAFAYHRQPGALRLSRLCPGDLP